MHYPLLTSSKHPINDNNISEKQRSQSPSLDFTEGELVEHLINQHLVSEIIESDYLLPKHTDMTSTKPNTAKSDNILMDDNYIVIDMGKQDYDRYSSNSLKTVYMTITPIIHSTNLP